MEIEWKLEGVIFWYIQVTKQEFKRYKYEVPKDHLILFNDLFELCKDYIANHPEKLSDIEKPGKLKISGTMIIDTYNLKDDVFTFAGKIHDEEENYVKTTNPVTIPFSKELKEKYDGIYNEIIKRLNNIVSESEVINIIGEVIREKAEIEKKREEIIQRLKKLLEELNEED